MDKNVRVIIRGLHNTDSDESDMVIDVKGTYYNKNGKHYICYEEKDENYNQANTNMLKMRDDNIELIKRGNNATHLNFEKGKINTTYYKTFAGNLYIGVDTKYMHVIEGDGRIEARIEYALVMDEQKVSDCVVEIQVIENI